MKVGQYFKQNLNLNLYIRELPINVHTKFIERNKSVIRELLDILLLESINSKYQEFEKRFNLIFSELLVRLKILNKEISQKFFSGIDDIAVPVSQFETLNLPIKRIFVVENKTTLYSILTLPKMERTIAIFGSGYSVYNLKIHIGFPMPNYFIGVTLTYKDLKSFHNLDLTFLIHKAC